METSKINLLNRIFSRSTLSHLIDKQDDKIYTSTVKRYITDSNIKNNEILIREIYNELKKNYRNEYYYKNTLLNKLLLGRYSLNTTTALTEFAIAKSKADFILVNKKAIVYEIKTELDNFDRLENQVNDYYKAFDYVVVVTCKENVPALLKKVHIIDKPIGIYVIQKNGVLSVIKKPEQYNKCLDKEVLFKTLRKAEYEKIIVNKFGYLPNVTQFKYYSECKKFFLQMPVEEAYLNVLKELKKRSNVIKEQFDEVPYELKFLAYFMNLRKDDYKRLKIFLNQSFGGD